MPDVSSLTATQLRELAAAKDWDEYCAARIARQKARIASITQKIAAKQNALEEAKAMLAAAEADAQQGPPVGWKKKADRQGRVIGVPAAEITAKGN